MPGVCPAGGLAGMFRKPFCGRSQNPEDRAHWPAVCRALRQTRAQEHHGVAEARLGSPSLDHNRPRSGPGIVTRAGVLLTQRRLLVRLVAEPPCSLSA
jgi:hypothetical protein